MKYIIENWTTKETIRTFNSEEEREKWIRENCTTFDNGTFITGTEVRISCYEEQSENEEEFKETLRIFMEDYNGFDWKNGTVVLVNNNRPKICTGAWTLLIEKYADRPIRDWTHDENIMVIIM